MAEDPFIETTAGLRDAIRDAHRTASAALGEAPRPGVRDAVLAAAARAVDAKPQSTARRAARNPFGARPWPLSAAALLVVSLMTGLIATRAMRDDPDRVTSAARPQAAATTNESTPPAEVAAPVAPLGPPAGTMPRAKSDDRETAATTSTPTPPHSTTPPSTTADRSVARTASPRPSIAIASPGADRARQAVATDAVRQVRPDDEAPRGALAGSSTFRGAEPVVDPKRASAKPFPESHVASPAPPAPASVVERSRPARDAAAEGLRLATPATPVAAPPPATATADEARSDKQASASINNAQRLRRAAEPLTPEAWVDRIVALRRAGEADAADREVEALHLRYPAFGIPAAALRPSGTR